MAAKLVRSCAVRRLNPSGIKGLDSFWAAAGHVVQQVDFVPEEAEGVLESARRSPATINTKIWYAVSFRRARRAAQQPPLKISE